MPIINSVISAGKNPTGTKQITTNGTYDVTDFASADVQVPTTAPAHYVEKTVVNGTLQSSTNIINLNGVTNVSDWVLAYDYYHSSFPANTTADLSSLTIIGGSNSCTSMFAYSSGITSVDLSGLTTLSGTFACANMLQGCSGITNVDLSALTTISGNTACSGTFISCTGLTSINFPSLTKISGNTACNNTFKGCTRLTTAKFNALNIITVQIAPSYGPMFSDCSYLESVEFGGLTASTFASKKDQFAYLFNSSTGSQATNGCTVHFPSNFDPSDPNHTFDASTLAGYPTFGGSASYIHIAFDLPATE